MKKSTKIWLSIAGAAIGIGAILVFIVMSTGGVRGVYLDSDWKLHTIEKNDQETYDSQPLTDITEIDINLGDEEIVIRESEDEFFHVHIDSNYGGRAYEEVNQGKLTITQESSMRWLSIDFSDWGKQNQVIVYVPRKNDLNKVTFETGDGNITAEVKLDVEELSAITSSGNILLENAISRDTTLKTSDGNITVAGEFQNHTSMKTSSGNITAKGSYGDAVDMKTSDGNINIETDVKRAVSGITAKTSDGVVRINGSKVGNDFEEKNGSKNVFQLKTSSGNISIDLK